MSKSICPHCSNTYSEDDVLSGKVTPCTKCYKCYVGDCEIYGCDCYQDEEGL